MHLNYVVDSKKYENVFEILKQEFKMSARLITKLKKNDKLLLNNVCIYSNRTVEINDKIDIYIDFIEDSSNILPTKIDLDILYEDEALLIINKPPHMPVHPSMLHYENTLSNGVKYYFDSINLKRLIRPVNRLDKDTSGIVVFAKNEYIQECLIQQMKNKNFKKEYLTIVEGIFKEKHGTINAPISRKSDSIIERCVCDNGDVAITHYDVLDEFYNMSLLHVILETGRTHQIRVHMAHIEHPILSDTLYGNFSYLINRQALHAFKISFIHPITQKEISIKSELPHDMKKVISIFKY